MFLRDALPKFTRFDIFFQTEKRVAYLLKDRLLKLLKDLMIVMFVTRGQTMTQRYIVDINVQDTDNLFDFYDMTYGDVDLFNLMDQLTDNGHEDIVD